MVDVQVYETPVMHSKIYEGGDTSDSINPSGTLLSNSPLCRSHVFSCAYAEPVFDQPSDYCTPVNIHMMPAKTTHLWRSKKLAHGDSLYEKPASNVRSLIVQLKQAKIKKIKRSDIRCNS